MPSAEFEPAIPALERPQTYALDRRPLEPPYIARGDFLFVERLHFV